MARTALVATMALATALLLVACTSNRGRSSRSAQRSTAPGERVRRGTQATAPAATPTTDPTRRRTTDTGSRFVDVSGPVGGIAVATSPLGDGATPPPYVPPAPTFEPAPTQEPAEEPRAEAASPARPDVVAAPPERNPGSDLGLPPTGPLPGPQLPPRRVLPPPPLPDSN